MSTRMQCSVYMSDRVQSISPHPIATDTLSLGKKLRKTNTILWRLQLHNLCLDRHTHLARFDELAQLRMRGPSASLALATAKARAATASASLRILFVADEAPLLYQHGDANKLAHAVEGHRAERVLCFWVMIALQAHQKVVVVTNRTRTHDSDGHIRCIVPKHLLLLVVFRRVEAVKRPVLQVMIEHKGINAFIFVELLQDRRVARDGALFSWLHCAGAPSSHPRRCCTTAADAVSVKARD